MEIIRGRLSSADFSNPRLRYNRATDAVQSTPDGGTTWIDSPQDDPRHGAGFARPLLTTGDIRCDASANMVKWLKDFIDYETGLLSAGAEVVTVANAGLALFDLISPFAILANLIIDIAGVIFGVGATALTAAFTSDQYDLLLCIFQCRVGADGSVTPAQFVQIQTDIGDQLNTTAALITNTILIAQGEMGLQNAGVIGGQTGDCSACDVCEWCVNVDFNAISGGWTPNHLAGSTASCGFDWGAARVDGQGFVNVGCISLAVAILLPAGTEITSVSYHSDTTAGTSPAIILTIHSDFQGTNVLRVNDFTTGAIDETLASDTYLGLLLQSPSGTTCGSGSQNIDSVTVTGKGTKPEILVGEIC